jgi:hypothetical protein
MKFSALADAPNFAKNPARPSEHVEFANDSRPRESRPPLRAIYDGRDRPAYRADIAKS